MNSKLMALITGQLLASAIVIPVVLLFRSQPSGEATTAEQPEETSAPTIVQEEVSPKDPNLSEIASAAMQSTDDPRAGLKLAEQLSALSTLQLRDLCTEALMLPKEQQRPTLMKLTAAWAELEGEVAMDWGRQNLSGRTWRDCFMTIGAAWAAVQPEEVAKWFELNRDDRNLRPDGQSWDSSVSAWLASADVVAAAKISIDDRGHTSDVIFNQLRFQIQTVEQIRAIAALLEERQWVGVEVKRRASASAPPGFRSYSVPGKLFAPWQVAKALESRWPEIDPEGWVKWCESHPRRADDGQSPSLEKFKQAPSGASARRVLESTRETERGTTMARIVDEWADADLNAAGEWLGEQGFTPETWPAIESFASKAIETDPEAAFAWLDAIPDVPRREAMIFQRFGTWLNRAPVQARGFLDGVDWPQDRLRRLRLLVR